MNNKQSGNRLTATTTKVNKKKNKGHKYELYSIHIEAIVKEVEGFDFTTTCPLTIVNKSTIKQTKKNKK